MPKIMFRKIASISLIFLLFFYLFAGGAYAEDMMDDITGILQDIGGGDETAEDDFGQLLEKIPEKLKGGEIGKQAKFEKPDICGEIVFDPTIMKIPITLQEVIQIVLDRNFDIKIFLARKNRDKWRYYQTITDLLPDITSNLELARISGTFLVGDILTDRVNESPFQVNFLLDFNLSIQEYFNLKQAFFEYKSAKKEVDFTREQVLLEAIRSYYELVRAKIDIEILRTNVEQIEEQFLINIQRVAAGAGTKFDVFRAEADRDNAIQRWLRRKNQYRLIQAQLANILGMPVFLEFEPSDKDVLVREIFHDCFTLDRAFQTALVNRDDLAASRLDVRAARVRKDAGYSIYVPEVSLQGLLAEQGTLQQGIFPARRIAMFVQWDGLTSLGLRGYTEVEARRAELQEQQLLLIDRTRNIQENIVRSFSDIITARQLIESTFIELESADKAREISLIRLKEGIGSFIDVIQTQNVFTESRIDNLGAIVGYNIAQIELLFEMGVLNPQNVLCGFNSCCGESNTNCGKAAEFNRKILEELSKEYEKYEQIDIPPKEGATGQLPGEPGILRNQEPGTGRYPRRER